MAAPAPKAVGAARPGAEQLAPSGYLDVLTEQLRAGDSNKKARIKLIDERSFNRLVQVPSWQLTDATDALCWMLRHLRSATRFMHGLKGAHRSVKRIQGHVRMYLLKKVRWRVQMLREWRKTEAVQLAAFHHQIRHTHEEPKLSRLKVQSAMLICPDEYRALCMAECFCQLCHSWVLAMRHWETHHAERCDTLWQQYREVTHTINHHRAHLKLRLALAAEAHGPEDDSVGRRRWEFVRLRMRSDVRTLENRRLQIIYSLLQVPSRPVFPWEPRQSELRFLCNKTRKVCRGLWLEGKLPSRPAPLLRVIALTREATTVPSGCAVPIGSQSPQAPPAPSAAAKRPRLLTDIFSDEKRELSSHSEDTAAHAGAGAISAAGPPVPSPVKVRFTDNGGAAAGPRAPAAPQSPLGIALAELDSPRPYWQRKMRPNEPSLAMWKAAQEMSPDDSPDPTPLFCAAGVERWTRMHRSTKARDFRVDPLPEPLGAVPTRRRARSPPPIELPELPERHPLQRLRPPPKRPAKPPPAVVPLPPVAPGGAVGQGAACAGSPRAEPSPPPGESPRAPSRAASPVSDGCGGRYVAAPSPGGTTWWWWRVLPRCRSSAQGSTRAGSSPRRRRRRRYRRTPAPSAPPRRAAASPTTADEAELPEVSIQRERVRAPRKPDTIGVSRLSMPFRCGARPPPRLRYGPETPI
eukprot:TRINITY_DN3181_c5_g1_i1.p1 TRINITY_DN3181_c5_g1~~TRINITY_DN3181_c5_g1_i1.p1  ORF type:complete len:691 (+),score=120.66 TRINITY_DN3181_c5_g1_i1:61-2133(+)